jgi:hypothetical protein
MGVEVDVVGFIRSALERVEETVVAHLHVSLRRNDMTRKFTIHIFNMATGIDLQSCEQFDTEQEADKAYDALNKLVEHEMQKAAYTLNANEHGTKN